MFIEDDFAFCFYDYRMIKLFKNVNFLYWERFSIKNLGFKIDILKYINMYEFCKKVEIIG